MFRRSPRPVPAPERFFLMEDTIPTTEEAEMARPNLKAELILTLIFLSFASVLSYL